MKISAVTVIYNPDFNVLANISTYVNSVEKLYIVDNSEVKNIQFLNKLKEYLHIEYIDIQGNKGIAHALNVGCNKAINDGYDWILTMDQDSAATPKMLENMFDYLDNVTNMDDISIIAPFHSNSYHTECKSNEPYSKVLAAMTSGNLLKLTNYKEIGPFKEDLFIDYVDNDYCLRSNRMGYKIIQVNNAILKHNLGELKQHRIFWKTFFSTNHSAIRRYYAFRNRIYIIKTYKRYFPEYCKLEKSRFLIDFIVVILYEKDKFQKIKMMLLGIKDALKNKYGKFND